ncbi:MAG: CAP domain-containing protein [Actinomycetota bacterium]
MNPVGLNLRRTFFLHKAVAGAAIALILMLGTSAAAAEPRTDEEASAEQQFIALANSSRSQSGLGSFSPSSAWVEHARNHSEQMSVSNSIFHDSNLSAEAGSIGCWKRVGENVGRGYSVGAIHSALMNSPTHRANLLGDFDGLGVGVEIAPDGMVYVTQRFLKSCSAPAPARAPAQAAPAPAPVVPAPVSAKKSTATAPVTSSIEPSREVKQGRLGGNFPFDLGI